jgi:hypothetical protein
MSTHPKLRKSRSAKHTAANAVSRPAPAPVPMSAGEPQDHAVSAVGRPATPMLVPIPPLPKEPFARAKLRRAGTGKQP